MIQSDEVLKQAKRYVEKFNKYFKLDCKIIIRGEERKCIDSAGQIILASSLKTGRNAYTITVYVSRFNGHKKIKLLEETMFHEMCHIALWPLTEDNQVNGKLWNYEERVVEALQKIYRNARKGR